MSRVEELACLQMDGLLPEDGERELLDLVGREGAGLEAYLAIAEIEAALRGLAAPRDLSGDVMERLAGEIGARVAGGVRARLAAMSSPRPGRFRRRLLAAAAAAGLLVAAVLAALALHRLNAGAGPAEAGRVAFVALPDARPLPPPGSGPMLVRDSGSGPRRTPAVRDAAVLENDRFETGPDAPGLDRALLAMTVSGWGRLDLADETFLEVAGPRRFRLLSGRIHAVAAGRETDPLTVTTPSAEVVADRAEFCVIDDGRGTELRVASGRVRMSAAGRSETVAALQASRAVRGGPPGLPAAIAPGEVWRGLDSGAAALTSLEAPAARPSAPDPAAWQAVGRQDRVEIAADGIRLTPGAGARELARVRFGRHFDLGRGGELVVAGRMRVSSTDGFAVISLSLGRSGRLSEEPAVRLLFSARDRSIRLLEAPVGAGAGGDSLPPVFEAAWDAAAQAAGVDFRLSLDAGSIRLQLDGQERYLGQHDREAGAVFVTFAAGSSVGRGTAHWQAPSVVLEGPGGGK